MSLEAGLKAVAGLANVVKTIAPVIWKQKAKDTPVTVQQNVVLQQHVHHHYHYYTTVVVMRRRRR